MRILCTLFAVFLASPLWAETVFFDATQDNTLYESLEGDVSNGAGDHFFVGRTAQGQKRRGLIAFKNLNTIPPGAVIKSVKLYVHLSREETPPATINLLRVQANWGEGASDAEGNEGQGAAAQAGDATWVYRFYNDQTWTQPGGDFPEVTSASLSVGGQGTHIFESSGMAADVQDWVNNPDDNFGWILVGDEINASAKRLDSRTNPESLYQPLLEVEYSVTGSPFDYSGVWYDPSLDGEGYLVYETPLGWLVYYFGYSADGQFLWLGSGLVTLEQLLFGVPFELPMYVGKPGTFDMPTPSSELTPWGTLRITFTGCETGEFRLEGTDGTKTSNVSKLVGVEGTSCLEI